MRIGILFFSGTGVTARFAREIAAVFSAKGHAVEMVRFKRGREFFPDAYDMIGFGAPAYSFFAPRIFLAYLRKLSVPKGTPFFLFVTCHGMSGITGWSMYRRMKVKGARLVAPVLEGRGINNIRSWRPYRRKPAPRDLFVSLGDPKAWGEELLLRAEGSGQGKGFPLAVGRVAPRFRPGLFLFTGLFSYSWQMAVVEGFFKKIDPDRCSGCGLCARKICPSGAITLDGGKVPEIRNSLCVGCSGCVNLCPLSAVYTRTTRNRHPFRGRSGEITGNH